MSKLNIDKILHGVIICPRCNKASRLIEWDSVTHSECITREMRRAFVSLEETKAYVKGTANMYKCPRCAEYSRGDKLKVRTDTAVSEIDTFYIIKAEYEEDL